MSNPTTNYTVGGLDLSNIFQPLVQGSAIGYNTNYTVSGHGDLSAIFAAYTGATGTQAPVTGYSVTGHGDLNTIFARKPIFAVTGSLVYTVDASNGYTGIVFTSGTGTITYFINIPAISIIAVGGGGGGSIGLGFLGGASGGGGATMLIPNFGVYANTPFNIVVGNGGNGENSGSPSSNGGDSSFEDPTFGPLLNVYIGGGGGGAGFVQSGGGGSISNNAIGGGGGGGGGGSGGGGVTAGVGGNNGTTYQGETGSTSAGGTSFNNYASSGYPIYLPFINGNQVHPGNGGGSGKALLDLPPPTNGGLAGSNVGGLYGGSSSVNGESAVSSINTGVFGAGGGGGGPGGNGGSGGSGVVIIYWQTI